MSYSDALSTTAADTPGASATVVAVRNLHVAWASNLILHGVNTTVPAGQALAITGANGSGKSTLIRAILGKAPITYGSVELFGIDTIQRSAIPWDRIGYVPQRVSSGGALTSSAEDVVRSGLPGPRRLWARPGDHARAVAALDRVGLAHRFRDPMSVLSGGQQQRVLIARALIRSPQLLIMDEPMAGIDAHSRARLAEVVSDARKDGTTILVVLHELGELAPFLDRELHIASGHISYDGPPHPDGDDEAHRQGNHHPDRPPHQLLSSQHPVSGSFPQEAP